MVNLEMEKSITSLSTEYIFNEAKGSLLLLLLSCIEDLEENSLSKTHEIHPDILNLKKHIHRATISLKEALGDKEIKLAALEDSFGLKKQIIAIYENIYRYYAQWNIISSIISDEVALRKYKEQNNTDKKIELSMFYTDCIDFIQSATSISQQKNFMGQLFKCVPFKMARDKYFQLVTESLVLAFGGESEESITTSLTTFKNTCAPDKSPNYGKYFPTIAKCLSDKMSIKPSSLSDEELDELYTDMNSLFENLSEIEDYCQEILNAIDSLIILFYLNFTLEDLTEENFGYADVYHKVCEILKNPEDNVFNETVKNLLEEYIEPIIDNANDINKKEMKLLEKITDFSDLSEDMSKTLATDGFVRATFYDDINEAIFNFNLDPDAPPASEDFKNIAFNNFIEFMKEYFSALPLSVRKSSMLMLLGSLPIAMDIHTLLDYIKDAIDNAQTFEHGLLIIDKAGATFTDNGFNFRTEDDEDKHHIHDEDCGCGHDHHHHDENCGCGHDHHHH
ncbi:MAG TPA: hypothetical protein DIC60_06225 [Lachnospiraceae bacterium]|nr:hypothetical protein [Lachnospiraceae bacterium]